MKNPFVRFSKLSLVALFILLCLGANAQLFVGGNVGLNTTGGSVKDGSTTTNSPSSMSYTIAPKVGYFLSEKMSAGAIFNFSRGKYTTPGTPEQIDYSTSLGLTPFVRYFAIKSNKFSVFGEADLGLSLSNTKSKIGGATNNGPKGTSIGLGIYPGVEYALTDKISLETTINIFRLGYTFSSSKQVVGGNDVISRSSGFNFGAGLNNVVNVGAITIGAYFRL